MCRTLSYSILTTIYSNLSTCGNILLLNSIFLKMCFFLSRKKKIILYYILLYYIYYYYYTYYIIFYNHIRAECNRKPWIKKLKPSIEGENLDVSPLFQKLLQGYSLKCWTIDNAKSFTVTIGRLTFSLILDLLKNIGWSLENIIFLSIRLRSS